MNNRKLCERLCERQGASRRFVAVHITATSALPLTRSSSIRLKPGLRTGFLKFALALFAFFSLAGLLTTAVIASQPQLNTILPRGVQRGMEHKLVFHGQRLVDAEEILFYDNGITVESFKANENGKQVTAMVRIADDCRLGEHVVQIRTNDGISEFRNLFVGVMPQVNESEPNNNSETSQSIESNVTAAGVIMPEDVDCFKIALKKGEQLSVEVEAMRLGFWIDAYLAVLGPDQTELATSDDTPLLKNDPFISLTAPKDGDYFIMLRESSYGGSNGARYRMHVGSFPRPTTVFPAGGKPNELATLSFLGDPSGPINQQVQLPARFDFRGGLFPVKNGVSSPSPIQFRINELHNIIEVEPNDSYWPKESVGTAPFAFNGIIEKERDADLIRFTGKKGQELDFQCSAQRVGSGLDPIINVWQASNKKLLFGDDDGRRPDCYKRFTLPADGDYFFRVKDHLDRGHPHFVYRVEISPVEPELSLNIPRFDRYSQTGQTISVPQGGRVATLVNATRDAVTGEIELLSGDLPDGITMHAPNMRENLSSMPVVFEATGDAKLAGKLVDLKGQIKAENGQAVIGGFVNQADFAMGPPNNSVYYQCKVNRLAMAVVEPVPYKVEIVPPQSPLVRNGQKEIKIAINREEGFDGPITLRFPFLPPGIGTKNKVNVPKGVSEFNYPINANGKAELGKWPIYVLATTNVKFGYGRTSSQLAEIEVAEPYVTFSIPRTSVQQGDSTKLQCTIQQLVAFEGDATAEIVGLPKQVVIAPMTFTKDTTELQFDISTTEDCPIAKHKGLICRVSIPVGEETVMATAGRGELRVKKPTPRDAEKQTLVEKPQEDQQ